MKQNVKNIKGIEFVCIHCQTSISFVFETHKVFLNECPNCGAEWLPQTLNIEAMKNIKHTLKTLREASGADISLICDDIEIK